MIQPTRGLLLLEVLIYVDLASGVGQRVVRTLLSEVGKMMNESLERFPVSTWRADPALNKGYKAELHSHGGRSLLARFGDTRKR